MSITRYGFLELSITANEHAYYRKIKVPSSIIYINFKLHRNKTEETKRLKLSDHLIIVQLLTTKKRQRNYNYKKFQTLLYAT